MHMVIICRPLIIVGCPLGSVISKIIYLTITLDSRNIAIIQRAILYLKRPLLFLLYCPQYGPQQHTMLTEISTIIFPGTNYNTVIALMSDYLCNILLQGSEDLSVEDNKLKVFDCVYKRIYKSGHFDHNATAEHDVSL